MRLKDQVALIVGGGRGLGRATALLFAKEEAEVAVAARTFSEVEGTASEVRKMMIRATAIQADATKSDQVKLMVEETISIHGRIDILVNSQGDWLIKPTLQTTENDWDHIMDTNLKSMYLTCREVLPHMIRRKQGHIFNIGLASGLWYPGGGIISIYKASKLGLVGFSKAIAE